MSQFRIKLVGTPEDLPPNNRRLLNDIDRVCFPLDELYRKSGCYWWMVFDGDEVVGFAGLKPLTGVNEGIGFMCRAGVIERVEGQGLQRRLIRVRLQRAKKLGLQQVLTYTNGENFSSAMNLLRCGMRFHKPAFKWGCPGAMYFSKELGCPVE